MSPEHNIMALAFIVFWLMTQADATKSVGSYLYRSIVVALYSVVISWPGHDRMYSNLEWIADGMVIQHFCEIVSFFKPDRGTTAMRRING